MLYERLIKYLENEKLKGFISSYIINEEFIVITLINSDRVIKYIGDIKNE